MPRHHLISVCTGFLFVFVTACGNGGEQSDPPSPEPPVEPPAPAAIPVMPVGQDTPAAAAAPSGEQATGEAAGVGWTVPARWQVQPPRMMRVATYLVPTAEGDDEPGECAVFFFGQGQGGSVELNLQRWQDQFETESGGPPTPAQRQSSINGIPVTTVSLAGTYLASMGPMFQSGAEKKPGYKMLGAIVEAPEGNVFLKLTGPEKTVLGAEGEFQDLMNSLRK